MSSALSIDVIRSNLVELAEKLLKFQEIQTGWEKLSAREQPPSLTDSVSVELRFRSLSDEAERISKEIDGWLEFMDTTLDPEGHHTDVCNEGVRLSMGFVEIAVDFDTIAMDSAINDTLRLLNEEPKQGMTA